MTGSHISLFAGVGMTDIAAEAAGYETVATAEIDPFCRKIISARFPEAQHFADVSDLCYLGMMPSAKITPAQFNAAVTEYRSGASVETIADHLPITRQALWERFKRADVTMRAKDRYGADNHFYRGGARGADWAHNKMEKALIRGDLVRPTTCETCGGNGQAYKDGRSPIQGHHDDYNQPLVVRWLCQGCHHVWHKNNVPVALEGVMPTEASEIQRPLLVSGGFP